jgi:ferredoxin
MSLETFKIRWPKNVPGQFYVDAYCTDCDLCRNLAPTVFVRDEEFGNSYVARQPKSPPEIYSCLEAVKGCPQDNVHDDGLLFDWAAIPAKIPWHRHS